MKHIFSKDLPATLGELGVLFAVILAIASFATFCKAADNSSDTVYPGVDLEPSGNPIFTDAWTCDPAALVVGDRVYVYTGEDVFRDGEKNDYPGNFNIPAWRVYSSSDMVHWRSHGVKLRPEDFPNGKKGIAWAAQCVQKGDKFYWFVTYNTQQGGHCIGVAIGDTPVGPFKPHPKPLVEDKDTPGRGWNDIDPTCLIDDDGTAWLAWGQNSFIAKLKDNMTEIDGEIIDLKLQSYIEGPWLYKRNGLYYNIYAGFGQGGGECINYSTAKNPLGPWTYRGQITGPAKNSFTIHPAVIDFKGHTYFFYHNGTLDRDGQRGEGKRRSVCVEEMFFNEDGTIKPITQTNEGVAGKAAGGERMTSIVSTRTMFPDNKFKEMPQDYTNPNAKAGTVKALKYKTRDYKTEGSAEFEKTCLVYLPAGYDEKDTQTRYNILYFMHGGGGSETSDFRGEGQQSRFKNFFDNMIAKGDIKPTIIVAPTYNVPYSNDATKNCIDYHYELVKDLIPAVEKQYHTYAKDVTAEGIHASKWHRAFSGFSMGSCCTWSVFEHCIDQIGCYIPISGDCWAVGRGKGEVTAKYLADTLTKTGYTSKDFRIYSGCGNRSDMAYGNLTPQIDAMKNHPDIFKYCDNFKDGNLYQAISEKSGHDMTTIMNIFYNGIPKMFE